MPFLSSLSDNEILEFPVTGGGSAPGNVTEKKVGELKATLDARVEPGESRVREEAIVLALKYPGDLTIDQIASIYSYLKNGDGIKKGWGYVRDPRGIDDFGFANKTLKIGDRANCVGGGDCDDFAILMSALIESIGGTTRIIMARNNTQGGHAYAEVYLGNLNEPNGQVEGIINWLKQQFNTDKIYTHIDTDTKDVWLNLDWGADEMGNAHPGGPFFSGDKHIVINIRDKYQKTPLKESSSEKHTAETMISENLTPEDKAQVLQKVAIRHKDQVFDGLAGQAALQGYADYEYLLPKALIAQKLGLIDISLTPEDKALLLQEIIVLEYDQTIFQGTRGQAALEGVSGYEGLLPKALKAQKLGLIDINLTPVDIIPTQSMIDDLMAPQIFINENEQEELNMWEAILKYPLAWNCTSPRGNRWHDEVAACMIAGLIP
ncbi:MAG: transglutaminase domain-containing protein [Methanothrix sp.]|nr:transglutaminase domain-containing protein [Methanothrix sp.]